MKSPKLIILFFLLVCFNSRGQDTLKKDTKWLRFNIQGALIANNSFSNLYQPSDDDYPTPTKNSSKPVCFGFNAGAEFLLGRGKIVKHIISFTYDLTNSNFNVNDYIAHPVTIYNPSPFSETWHENISRQVQFINLNYGLLFRISKRIKLATIVSFFASIGRNTITNGYLAYAPIGNYTNSVQYDTLLYHNDKENDSGNAGGIAIKLRASYDITKYLSVFVSRNFIVTSNNNHYVAPWWMIGLQFYPFKKLR